MTDVHCRVRHWLPPRSLVLALALVAGSAPGVCAAAEHTPPAERSPEETVTRYLVALKSGDFAAAYDCVSTGMAQHKSRDAWAKEQQWTMQMAEAKIFDYEVFPGKIAGDKAYVPNILSSQDRFLNQLGVKEHELYTLIREGGAWKIDQQQLVEKADLPKWFSRPDKK